MDSAYYDADDGGGGGGGRGGVGGDGGVEDAYPSPSSSLGRSPIPRDNDGGLEESSPRSSGPVFVHGTDDIHASDHDTKHNGEGESKRYPVASVEFARVETPFIIGVWIFCASLAKIGEYHDSVMCTVTWDSCIKM
jgi:sodium/hydrogen exchanger-like protein 3